MVVTCGEKVRQCMWMARTSSIPVFPPDHIADPTGVGDAFRGGFLTGISLGWIGIPAGRWVLWLPRIVSNSAVPKTIPIQLQNLLNAIAKHLMTMVR